MNKLIIPILLIASIRVSSQTCFNSTNQFSCGSFVDPILVSDFDGDGNVDVVVGSQYSEYNMYLMLGTGTGNFGTPIGLVKVGTPRGLYASDFDNDGLKDIAICGSTSTVTILKGLANGGFSTMGQYIVGSRTSVTGNDFNNDGFVDLAFCGTIGNFSGVSVLNAVSAGSFAPAYSFTFSGAPYSIISHDFNKDGNFDLATANTQANNISIFQGNGAGNFAISDSMPVIAPFELLAADFNGDSRLDIAVASLAKSVGIVIFLQTTNGSYSLANNYTFSVRPGRLTSTDFNNDGFLDLATPLYNSSMSVVAVLLGDGSGNFMPAINYNTHQLAVNIAPGDFNNDGRADLAVTHYSLNSVSLLLNCFSTAVSESYLDHNFEIWPNPSNGHLKITSDFPGVYDLKLINSLGQCNWSGSTSDNDPVFLENVPDGIYTFIFNGPQGVLTRRVIITK